MLILTVEDVKRHMKANGKVKTIDLLNRMIKYYCDYVDLKFKILSVHKSKFGYDGDDIEKVMFFEYVKELNDTIKLFEEKKVDKAKLYDAYFLMYAQFQIIKSFLKNFLIKI